MKRLIVSLNAKYAHKGPAAWMLRAACAREGFAAEVFEAEIARPPDALLRAILAKKPDVVAFSCYIWNIALVQRLTAALRAAAPECILLWGGPEVSYDAARRMQQPIRPDAIVAGEGEEVFPALLWRIATGRPLEGVGVGTALRDGGIAPPVAMDRWVHLYPPGAVAEPNKLHYVETARGCPFACRYCLSAVQGGVRALPAQEAVARLIGVRDAGARTVKVLDRTFNFDSARARAIWGALMRAGGESTYHFEIAAHLLGPEDLSLLRAAPKGLFQFEIGVQTTGEAALAAIDRGQDFAELSRAVHALRAADNIHLHLDLIAGLPEDGYRDFALAVDRALALRPHALQLGFLKLLPGTPIRADFDAAGWPFDPAPPYEVIRSDAMDEGELARLHAVEEVLSIYYNSAAYPRTAGRWLRRFADFERVALSLLDEGFFDVPRSSAYRLDALWRALPGDAERDLRVDWLASGQREYRPWMRGEPVAAALRPLALPPAVRRKAHAERVGEQVLLFLPNELPRPLF